MAGDPENPGGEISEKIKKAHPEGAKIGGQAPAVADEAAEVSEAVKSDEALAHDEALAPDKVVAPHETAAVVPAEEAAAGETGSPAEPPVFKNRKEQLYDKIPLTYRQVDILVKVLVAGLLIALILGVVTGSLFH